MKCSIIQINTQGSVKKNIDKSIDFIERIIISEHPDLIVLPECFNCLSGDQDFLRAAAEHIPDGYTCQILSELAQKGKCTIHGGSIIERADEGFFNTSAVFGPDGSLIARYRKIHRFDALLSGGLVYRESDLILGGNEIVTYQVGDFKVGCAICYDVRFPALFSRLVAAGCHAIVLPAAFTVPTGRDHWNLLCQSRALDTQCYVVAAGGCGDYDNGERACWGHSLAVDPWGNIIGCLGNDEGTLTVSLSKKFLNNIRSMLPVTQHQMFIPK